MDKPWFKRLYNRLYAITIVAGCVAYAVLVVVVVSSPAIYLGYKIISKW